MLQGEVTIDISGIWHLACGGCVPALNCHERSQEACAVYGGVPKECMRGYLRMVAARGSTAVMS
eukprot:3196621-Rhodomonas_salina.1